MAETDATTTVTPRRVRPIKAAVGAAEPTVDEGATPTLVEPRRSRPMLDPLTGPFVVCLIVGAALAAVGHVRGFETLGFVGPVLASAAYPINGWLRGFHRQPHLRERFADNSYYLGFLFTQVALLVSFGLPVLLKQTIAADDVLRLFGVAIGASMVGLLARTIIVQTGLTVDENADVVEREVELLAESVETMARGVSVRTRQVLSDLTGVATGLSQARAQLDRELGDWTASLGERLRDIDAALNRQTASLDGAATLVARVASATEKNLTADQAALSERVGTFAEAIGSLQEGLRAQLGEVAESVAHAGSKVVESTSAIVDLQAGIRQRTQEATETIRSGLDSLAAATKALSSLAGLDEVVAAVGGRVEETASRADEMRSGLLEATSSIRAAGEAAVSDVRATALSIRTQTEHGVRQLSSELTASAELFEATLADFRRELERLRA